MKMRTCATCRAETQHKVRKAPGSLKGTWVCKVCQEAGDPVTAEEIENELAGILSKAQAPVEHEIPAVLPRVFIACAFSDEGIEVLEDAVAAHYRCRGAAPVVGKPLSRRPIGHPVEIQYGNVIKVLHAGA